MAGLIMEIVIMVLMIVSRWLIYNKAGKPGWAAIIPIYTTFVLVSVSQKGWGWALGMILAYVILIIPIVGWFIWIIFMIVARIIVLHGISKSFGKGGGFTAGLFFLPFIFFPILAFGDAKWTAVEVKA